MSIDHLTFVESYINNRKKSGVVAYVLWFFLGMFGAHRFYMGRTISGIFMLFLTLLFSWWTFSLIPGIWVFIDLFLISRWLRQDKEKLRLEALELSQRSHSFDEEFVDW